MKQINLEKYKSLAERYTKSLWSVAEEDNLIEKIGEDLRIVADTFVENADIEGFFVNPIIKIDDKKEILEKSFAGKIDERVYNFLNILVDKNRMFLLPNIKYMYDKKLEEKQNLLAVEAQTVVVLDEEMENRLKDKLARMTGKSIKINNVINPSIIGGVVLRFGGKVIDGSVQTQLKRLQKQLI